ncbi:MAG TPA: leucine--tRNA ligase [Polyangiaceae bacterium]|nr:leucine--tRNA ligase [Polyangiaceae bacterium]
MIEPSEDRYDPSAIEPKWQRFWEERGTFVAKRRPGREKAYVLDMFPYPSGAGLHVGHPEGYTATDIVCRHKRMRGVDVLHPMGWDAFGLPAEQHAIRTGTHPRATTAGNIENFRRQLKALGFSYDWSREVDTTDPGYVRWTQWIFLQLWKRGLAFQQSDMPVNWCPALGTVLANDEIVDGKSEVGGFPVERLKIRQWSLRITEYADRLAEDLAALDWPETKLKQLHWIGRSEGAIVDFVIDGAPGAEASIVKVFTTRVDTLAGATYVVLAPEHPLTTALASAAQREEVLAYVAAAAAKSDIDRSDATREKTGVALGVSAKNPLNGERVPVWVGDYVIGSYGTGAVMAVPAHDERDHAFAVKYNLPIVGVIAPADGRAVDVLAAAFTDDGVTNEAARARSLCPLPAGTSSEEARRAVTAWLAAEGQGEARVTYRLRDWVFSRQRYWGEPIPIYFPVRCDGDPRLPGASYEIDYATPLPVPEAELPLVLPDLEDFKPGTDPAGPLARAADWRFFQKDGAWFARETNTMPQWAGSCWYYLRFLDPTNTEAAWSQEAYDAWMPVDLYMGGAEHAVLHLLYARFWHKVLFDLGLVSHGEPFTRLVHQGLILGEDSQKMSKSRGNVVNPDDVVKSHGADSLRLYEMFMGPLEAVKPWQTSGIEGVRRFLDRVWNVATGPLTDDPAAYDLATRRAVHKTVKKVGDDIEALRFNTAISAMMILVKALGALPAVPREAAKALVLLVSPFAPHLGEELWSRLGATESLAYEPWPSFDPALVRDAEVEIGVQVNGKVRSVITLEVDATEETARAVALEDEKVRAFIGDKTLKKFIYVKGKIVNVVVA